MSVQPRVLVAGAFGQGNPGDEAILDALVQALDGCEVRATGAGRLPGGLPCPLVPAGDPAEVAAVALGSDLVVITATVFKALHPSSGRHRLALLANTLALVLAMRARGRPVALVGAGAGSLPGRVAPALARSIAASAGRIDLRDEESASVLRTAGVRRPLPVGADVTWSVMPQLPASRADPDARPLAVVALSHLAGGDGLVDSLNGALNELTRDGFALALQPWQLPQDAAIASSLAKGVDGPVDVWAPPGDLASASRRLRGSSVVVGLRFHSLVAAGTAAVPFVAVAHEPKLAGLARRLGQPAVAPDAPGTVMAGAVREAASGPPPSPEAVTAERRSAADVLAGLRGLAFERARARTSSRAALAFTGRS